jgi:hypothetical protein
MGHRRMNFVATWTVLNPDGTADGGEMTVDTPQASSNISSAMQSSTQIRDPRFARCGRGVLEK